MKTLNEWLNHFNSWLTIDKNKIRLSYNRDNRITAFNKAVNGLIAINDDRLAHHYAKDLNEFGIRIGLSYIPNIDYWMTIRNSKRI